MQKGVAVGALACLVLAAAGGAYFFTDPDARFHRRSIAEDAVRAKLKDPDSAKFTEVTAIKIGGKPHAICGYVNAKNSYGAYSGPRRFYVPLSSPSGLILAVPYDQRQGEDYSDVDMMFATLCSGDTDAVMSVAESMLPAK